MNKVYFTKVFKGYSPEEVEAFIIKLNNDLQQKQQESTDVSKRLNSEITELKKNLDETLLRSEKLAEENRSLNLEKQNLLDEIKRLSSERVERVTVPVKNETPAVQNDNEEDRIKYRRFCEQIGEKLLIADMRASEIIKEAEREANLILSKAEANADKEIEHLIEDAKSRSEVIYKIIAEYEKKQIYISAGLDQARKHIADSISEVEALISVNKKD